MSLPTVSDVSSETSSILSEVTQYTLALNPEDWEDEWHYVIDGGEVEEESANSCTQCKKTFKGKKENYGTWLARHIRLHSVQGTEILHLIYLPASTFGNQWVTKPCSVIQREGGCCVRRKTWWQQLTI